VARAPGSRDSPCGLLLSINVAAPSDNDYCSKPHRVSDGSVSVVDGGACRGGVGGVHGVAGERSRGRFSPTAWRQSPVSPSGA